MRLRMRPRLYILLLFLLLTLAFLATHVLFFIRLFFEHSGIAITQEEIAAAHVATTPDQRPQLIPKIIHQIYHDLRNAPMPPEWDEARHSCIALNRDWDYKGCLENLEPLLYYPTFTTDGGRGALSNNILGSAPNNPFWKLLTDSLIPYNYNYFFPYITVSYASGQWFETAVWQTYHARAGVTPLHRIMMDCRSGRSDDWIYFTQTRGESWRNWDNAVFLWVGEHVVLLSAAGCALILLFGWAVKLCVSRSRCTDYGALKQLD